MESPHTLETLFDLRIEWLQTHRYSKNTISAARLTLAKFAQWALTQNLNHPAQITSDRLEAWQTWVKHQKGPDDKPWSVSYQYQLLSEVLRCFQWAYRQKALLTDPTTKIKRPKLSHALPKNLLSWSEIELLLRQPNISTSYGLRDRAILEVFCGTVIRCQELLHLCLEDIDRRNEMLHIREGKGSKDRVIPINERALNWIARYELEVREKWRLKGKAGSFLFLSDRGNPLSQTQCTLKVRQYLQAVNPKIKGSTHLIRCSIATIMLENNCDIRYIQELLGHSNLDTTQIYAQVSQTHLSQSYQKFHPSACEN